MTSPQSFENPQQPADQALARPWCAQHDRQMDAVRPAGTTLPDRGGTGTSWVCPRCAEIAIDRAAKVAHERHDAARAEARQQGLASELEKRLGRACIPKRYRELSFDTFPREPEDAYKACSMLRTYANRFPQMADQGISILLVGRAGTGKTGLACCVANAVIREHHRTALFISAYGAVRHMRDTWGRRGRTETEALADLVEPDLLVLDEVGSSVGSDTETAALFEVLNGRYQEKKPTIVLSNLPMDDYDVAGAQRPGLRTYLGPRVVDRFRDDGSFTLAFNWASLRGARA